MELKDKAIDIKGKSYVLVSDRVLYFNETYPNGSITTELLPSINDKQFIIKATVTPDITHPLRAFIGHSQAVIGQGMVNTTAALENAETSAVGRALGMMGIGVLDSIASADEMVKADVKKDLGNCEKCGALNAWSTAKNKVYCSQTCWRLDKQ